MRKLLFWGVHVAFALGALVFLVFGISVLREKLAPVSAATTQGEAATAGPKLVGRDTVRLEAEVVKSLGLRVAAVKKAHGDPGLPPLPGSLAFDADHLARVQSPFPGVAVELGQAEAGA